jgi:hypothetical protein
MTTKRYDPATDPKLSQSQKTRVQHALAVGRANAGEPPPDNRKGPGGESEALPNQNTCTAADTQSIADLAIPELEDGATNLDAAMSYAAGGLYVLPVRRGTKDPGSVVGKNWQGR